MHLPWKPSIKTQINPSLQAEIHHMDIAISTQPIKAAALELQRSLAVTVPQSIRCQIYVQIGLSCLAAILYLNTFCQIQFGRAVPRRPWTKTFQHGARLYWTPNYIIFIPVGFLYSVWMVVALIIWLNKRDGSGNVENSLTIFNWPWLFLSNVGWIVNISLYYNGLYNYELLSSKSIWCPHPYICYMIQFGFPAAEIGVASYFYAISEIRFTQFCHAAKAFIGQALSLDNDTTLQTAQSLTELGLHAENLLNVSAHKFTIAILIVLVIICLDLLLFIPTSIALSQKLLLTATSVKRLESGPTSSSSGSHGSRQTRQNLGTDYESLRMGYHVHVARTLLTILWALNYVIDGIVFCAMGTLNIIKKPLPEGFLIQGGYLNWFNLIANLVLISIVSFRFSSASTTPIKRYAIHSPASSATKYSWCDKVKEDRNASTIGNTRELVSKISVKEEHWVDHSASYVSLT